MRHMYRKEVPADFEETEKARVSTLSNRVLYEELIYLAAGDDYDGCFTREGDITFKALQSEFEERLKDWLGVELPSSES